VKENSDGNDTNVGSIGNSIEEDMKYIHKTLNDMRIKDEDTFISAVATIFRDYKRVLKENEILKKEKEQAWEEWNNLEQGSYETEQKLKQQLKKLQKENEELNEKILDNAGIYQLGFKDGEESYIKKVKDKIRKNEEIIDISNDGDLIHELFLKNKVYEELLESEE
jgi:glutathionyl-hydroquinone reductase